LIGTKFPLNEAQEFFKILEPLHSLKYLTLDHTHLNRDAHVVFDLLLSSELPAIEHLSMNYCGLLPEHGYNIQEIMKKCTGLESISLIGNKLRDHGLQDLNAGLVYCERLKSLNLAFNEIEGYQYDYGYPLQDTCQIAAQHQVVCLDAVTPGTQSIWQFL
jgi:Ran GTPase-activating protein (RanGAP) involved in mRNA processing and transport